MKLSEIVHPSCVLARLAVAGKKELFEKVAACLAPRIACDSHKVFDVLLEREKLGSTAIGNGIAIPHGKLADMERIVGVLATLREAVDFEAPDGEPVDIVMALVAPSEAGGDHLRALALVSRFFRNARCCSVLRAAQRPQDMLAMLEDA